MRQTRKSRSQHPVPARRTNTAAPSSAADASVVADPANVLDPETSTVGDSPEIAPGVSLIAFVLGSLWVLISAAGIWRACRRERVS